MGRLYKDSVRTVPRPETPARGAPAMADDDTIHHSGLRLSMAEMFALCLVRLWTMGRECEQAENTLRMGFVRGQVDPIAADEFETLLLILSTAPRPLQIAEMHARFVTDDELTFLSLLGSAQAGDLDGILAPLRRWLPTPSVRMAVRPVVRFAKCLMRQGHHIRPMADFRRALSGCIGSRQAHALAPEIGVIH